MKHRNKMIGARLISADKKSLEIYKQGAELMCLAEDHILYHMDYAQIVRILTKFNRLKVMKDSARGIVNVNDIDAKVLRVKGTLKRIIKEHVDAQGKIPKELLFTLYKSDGRTINITRKEFEFILKQIEGYKQARRRYNGTRCVVLVKA